MDNQLFWIWGVVNLILFADITAWLILYRRHNYQAPGYVRIGRYFSVTLSWLRFKVWPVFHHPYPRAIRSPNRHIQFTSLVIGMTRPTSALFLMLQREMQNHKLLTKVITQDSLEVVIIVACALGIASPYANLDPQVWPIGADFPHDIQLFSTWQNFLHCGDCVLWNGNINGGSPAFADMESPVLNPFYIVAMIVWGTVNGSKMLLVLSFFLAGLGQLWLGRVLSISRSARLWMAVMAIIGGHLTARMELGLVGLVFSIACASLMLPAALSLARTGRRRDTVLLALTMALTLLSGHGYTQIAILLGFLPVLALYCFNSSLKLRPVVKNFLWAAGLTLLLTAAFWLPFTHFYPYLQKSSDPNFSGGQPVLYALLNLIIPDRSFFEIEILGKHAVPAYYSMYIGWIPIALAMFGFWLTSRAELRTKLAIFAAVILIYVASSGAWFHLFINTPFNAFFSMARNTSLEIPIAIPLILAMAGWGIDGLRRFSWPTLHLELGKANFNFNLKWLLVIPLLLALESTWDFARQWLRTDIVSDSDVPVATLATSEARWVGMPFMEFLTYPKAIEANIKIVIQPDFTIWNWKGRALPAPQIELVRDTAARSDPGYTYDLGPYSVLEYPDRPYAYVQVNNSVIPCFALATGGHIDVNCANPQGGTLVVNENYFSGWQATVNGTNIPVSGDLINLPIPAGVNRIELRYHPWDALLGIVLSLLGLLLCGWVWFHPVPGLPESVPLEELSDIPDNPRPQITE